MKSFSSEKCIFLEINCDGNDGSKVNGMGIKVVEYDRYLGDLFNIKGCRERHIKAKGPAVELCSQSRLRYFKARIQS